MFVITNGDVAETAEGASPSALNFLRSAKALKDCTLGGGFPAGQSGNRFHARRGFESGCQGLGVLPR